MNHWGSDAYFHGRTSAVGRECAPPAANRPFFKNKWTGERKTMTVRVTPVETRTFRVDHLSPRDSPRAISEGLGDTGTDS